MDVCHTHGHSTHRHIRHPILLFATDSGLHRHRAPTAELPTTAALVGGLVAQEAIKVITRQYVPVDGTCVVDLVASTTGTIKV